jgi:hypothetical protein
MCGARRTESVRRSAAPIVPMGTRRSNAAGGPFFSSLLNEKPPLHPTAARRHAQPREIYAGQAQRSRKIRDLVLQRGLSSACAYYVTREEDRGGGIEYTLFPSP